MPTVKSLDVIVPIMAGCYFLMTLYVVFTNLPQLPGVLTRIFSEAFGLRPGGRWRLWSRGHEWRQARPFFQ